mmetsp:Transcript_2341/g.3479  ORF Transcript_2341/g.3479 Transcript_2341/m.3479 type:complete len:85 (+) Transcript_2341:3-257(+)
MTYASAVTNAAELLTRGCSISLDQREVRIIRLSGCRLSSHYYYISSLPALLCGGEGGGVDTEIWFIVEESAKMKRGQEHKTIVV